ncbi:MAG: T9SS type A sorting domain-containing protein, partial [Ignavibacteriales bacterium]|nr:T9SS type A sorting domain-containing protein [Ignavibacteriales bacterium]
FGTSTTLAVTKDFQVGTTTVDSLPVSSLVEGKSCATCHGVNGPTGHHGAKGAEQCLPCHTDGMPGYPQYAFSEFVHVFHQNDPAVNIPIGNCASCHNNASENQFTSDAPKVCSTCHGVVPSMPSDHSAVPLYASSGMSCATVNCHGGGTLGVFKTISETHANLAAKYADRDVVAKKTTVVPVIDGVADALWNTADSITTLSGIKMKFVYDTTYLYAMTTWKDAGYKMYAGGAGSVVPSTKSLARNKWAFDGTNWTKSGSEDRIAFVWKMNDPLNASCARTCHDVGVGHLTSTGKMDGWHWKAQRTAPVNLTDDGYWDKSGRKNDAVLTGTFGWENLNATSTLPIYMPKTAVGNADYLMASNITPFINSGFTAGATIPGWVVNDSVSPAITGSRADVITGSSYNETTGMWTVEFRRLLKTNYTDDVQFDPLVSYPFSVAKFDNTGSGHASQGVDITTYNLKFSSLINSVELNPGSPNKYELSQNYPNPFNPSTTINFAIKEKGNVKISLYDIKGELVKTLYNAITESGYHSLKFSARNINSGVYFYRIESGKFTETKKMVYLK